MTKEKPETLKDLRLKAVYYLKLKEAAKKYFIYGCKKRMNPYKMFLRFHNITEEELKND